MKHSVLLCAIFFLFSCTSSSHLAPVADAESLRAMSMHTAYIVKPQDTLYAIAFRYDKDFRVLAAYNRIQEPYRLRVGQVIYLQAAHGSARKPVRITRSSVTHLAPTSGKSTPIVSRAVLQAGSQPTTSTIIPRASASGWLWPIHGRISKAYAPGQGNKGVDIAGQKGAPVYASAAGVVAYAGNGLPGYGNLIIVKHHNNMLTAYSHNERSLVKEGQAVKRGQIIARVGILESGAYGLHYEVRRAGKPVNPEGYLK